MSLLTAILLFFGIISPKQAHVSNLNNPQYMVTIGKNMEVVNYFKANPGEIGQLAGTYVPSIDRAED